jgi:curved DNA-binding protein CbpA
MGKLHTHYDNLKVSRDAPSGVIKAAYKALAQENHPDRCKDANAPRRMQMINDAYAVLSDAKKRAEHDKWIRVNEVTPTPSQSKAHSVVDARTKLPVDSAYVEKLHTLYRAKLSQNQQEYAAELKRLKGFTNFQKRFFIFFGILISIPAYIIFSDIDSAIQKAHADQAQQYQEANMRRN